MARPFPRIVAITVELWGETKVEIPWIAAGREREECNARYCIIYKDYEFMCR